MNTTLVLTDNQVLLGKFNQIVLESTSEVISKWNFQFAISYNNRRLIEEYRATPDILVLNVKQQYEQLIDNYDLIISLHCKQLFPEELVKSIRCINVHPGLNPYNRGWYPQVFSIVNGLPCGATIHEIDEHLDHGAIICQKRVEIESWDTSLSMYNKIIDTEISLIKENLAKILERNYEATIPDEGNLNFKRDFDELCELDLNQKDTLLNHINLLRALTHGNYKNAFFSDREGNRVFLRLEISKE